MIRNALRARIVDIGIIPSVRTSSAEDARFAAETVARAGIPIVEVTMTVPHALDIIAELSAHMPDVLVGAGTVFDVQSARECAAARARFVTSPGLDPKIVECACCRRQIMSSDHPRHEWPDRSALRGYRPPRAARVGTIAHNVTRGHNKADDVSRSEP